MLHGAIWATSAGHHHFETPSYDTRSQSPKNIRSILLFAFLACPGLPWTSSGLRSPMHYALRTTKRVVLTGAFSFRFSSQGPRERSLALLLRPWCLFGWDIVLRADEALPFAMDLPCSLCVGSGLTLLQKCFHFSMHSFALCA